jgi:hypothetical protein
MGCVQLSAGLDLSFLNAMKKASISLKNNNEEV